MKKVGILVLLLTLFLMQGVAVAQQTAESSFNPSSYTLNPKIKVGDSILMKAVIAETDLGNGTVLPNNQQTTKIIYTENSTLNMTIVSLGSESVNLTDTLRQSNGTLVTQWQEPELFSNLYNGYPAVIMTTNSSLFTNIAFANVTGTETNCTGNHNCVSSIVPFGNFTTTVTSNEVIISGINMMSPVSMGETDNIIQFKYIFDRQSGWLKEDSETFTQYDSMFKANDIYKLDLVTVSVSSGAQISSLSGTNASSPGFLFVPLLASLTIMSLLILKKKKSF